MFGHGRKDRLRQRVALEQMAEIEDRRLVRDGVAPELQATERAHRLDVVERFLGPGIGERVPLLQAVDAQHRRQREWTPPALRTDLGIMRLYHRLHRTPRHNGRHLG